MYKININKHFQIAKVQFIFYFIKKQNKENKLFNITFVGISILCYRQTNML